METFKALEEKLDAVLSGAKSNQDFYTAIFGKIVLLNATERTALLEKAARIKVESRFDTAALSLMHGMSLVFDAEFQKSISFLETANGHFEQIAENGGVMSANTLLSITYRSMGQLDLAQAHLQTALKAAPRVSPESLFRYFKTVTYYQAGELHTVSKNYEAAREYYIQGMEFVGEHHELHGRLLNGLGNMMMQTEEWEQALDNFNRSLETAKQAKNPLLESKIYADIGNYYLKKKNYPLALENQYKSLEIRNERNFVNPSITNYTNLAEIYLQLNDTAQAIKFGLLAVETAARLNVMIKLYEAHAILAKAYEKAGDTAKAYEHFKHYHKYKEEVHNQEAIKKIEQLRSNHKIELMQQEKEIFRLKNVELRALLDEIGDSFRYASRIQNSLLPSERYIERTLERLKKK
jgi:tetratricopeptide (TPR) repeat protein